MDILRFITAGNVDDGKSTLIGRLLYDTKNIKQDVLHAVSAGDGTTFNLAHITDGLRSERQQGITIDVAYKYFTTPTRKYIITDAPGHFQFTRNLVTGASCVDVMIILIDAQHGITEQTRRHLLVASFLHISQVVVVINKMDISGYSQQVFNDIKDEFAIIASKINLHDATYIPVSALYGDNITAPSENTSWYNGETLMHYLENAKPAVTNGTPARCSVQHVISSNGEMGYLGKILSGQLAVNDTVAVYPEMKSALVTKIIHGFDSVHKAYAGQNVCLCLSTRVQRGDLIAHYYEKPKLATTFTATLCWLNAGAPLLLNQEYILRINTKETHCRISEVISKTDVETFEQLEGLDSVDVNEFAKVKIQTNDTIVYDPYTLLPENGRGIIIDTDTNSTVGAFVIN